MRFQTRSIDYINAFCQATLDDPVWVHFPQGFEPKGVQRSGYCLKLKKSLYGLSNAPKIFFKHLTAGIIKLGFLPCDNEPCLFIRHDMILVAYCDDVGIACKEESTAIKFVADLRAMGYALELEGSFNAYLGIKFSKLSDGSLEMTQRGLIDKIITAAGLEDSKPVHNPTAGELGADPQGPDFAEAWNYRSIVGMMMYLSTNTRPDIAFAVSQVARFGNHPKESHGTAVKRIIRYLKATCDKGTIVPPIKDLSLNVFVDADFLGLHDKEVQESMDSVRSRTGFIIKLGGFPLIWKSQLQTAIATSTMMAEYCALSASIRVLIPICG